MDEIPSADLVAFCSVNKELMEMFNPATLLWLTALILLCT